MTDIEIVWRSSHRPGIQRRVVVRAEHWTLDEQTTALTAEGNVILRVQGAVVARGLERPDTLDEPSKRKGPATARTGKALSGQPDFSYLLTNTTESSADYWAGVEDALRWVLGDADPAAFRD